LDEKVNVLDERVNALVEREKATANEQLLPQFRARFQTPHRRKQKEKGQDNSFPPKYGA
jgi:hypothetical protein